MDECYPSGICGACPMCAPWVAAGAPAGAVALGTDRAPRWSLVHDPLTCRDENHDTCLDAQVKAACTCRTCPMHAESGETQ